MNTPENTQRDREMILHPYRWPYFYLPLKRRVGNGFPEVGVLTSASTHVDSERTVKVNLTIFGPIGEVEEVKYPDVDALLDDGWRVD